MNEMLENPSRLANLRSRGALLVPRLVGVFLIVAAAFKAHDLATGGGGHAAFRWLLTLQRYVIPKQYVHQRLTV